MNPEAKTLVTSVTAVALEDINCEAVVIQNDPGSAVNILFGGPDAQTMVLEPGASMSLNIKNTNRLWVRSASGTPTLNYMTLS